MHTEKLLNVNMALLFSSLSPLMITETDVESVIRINDQ